MSKLNLMREEGRKVSKYDQEIPQSHTADNPQYHEEEPQNTNCVCVGVSCPRQQCFSQISTISSIPRLSQN